jgi:hypothetical protein
MDIKLDGQSAVIESMNVAGRKLQYNASNPRFAFYTTAQSAVYMIPWTPDTTPRVIAETKEFNVSAAEITVEIPYNQLTGIIGDAYFPAERTLSQGDIQLIPFTDAKLEDYELFAEIIADPNGTKLLLTTNQWVQDVRIQQLEWSSERAELLSTNTIFAANILKNTDGILFEADFESELPAYGISYTKNGEIYQYYFINGEIIQLSSEY